MDESQGYVQECANKFVENLNKGQNIEAASWFRRLCITGGRVRFQVLDYQENKVDMQRNFQQEQNKQLSDQQQLIEQNVMQSKKFSIEQVKQAMKLFNNEADIIGYLNDQK